MQHDELPQQEVPSQEEVAMQHDELPQQEVPSQEEGCKINIGTPGKIVVHRSIMELCRTRNMLEFNLSEEGAV